MKTSTCHDATLKHQPNKIGTILQYFYTTPTSYATLSIHHKACNFANSCPTNECSTSFLTSFPNLVPRPCAAFHRLQYGKAGEGLV